MAAFTYLYTPDERDDQCHIFELSPDTTLRHYRNATAWCAEQWGKPDTKAVWYMSESLEMIWIGPDSHAVAFRLRWC